MSIQINNSAITGVTRIQIGDATAPPNPGAGLGSLYKKTGDSGLYWKPDAAGAETNVSAGGFITQAADEGTSTTTTNTPVTKTTLTTPASLSAGIYRLGYSFEAFHTSTISTCQVTVTFDSVDVAQSGSPVLLGQAASNAGFAYVTVVTPGVKTATITFLNSNTGIGTASIRRARLELSKIS